MGPSCVACLCDELVSHIPATSPSFPTRLQKRPCSRARAATAPGRFGPGSTFVRSRSKFATAWGAGGGSPWAVVRWARARRNYFWLIYRNTLY
jgi:hypothetical protein